MVEAVDIQPIKASLVTDLVDLINLNLADLVQVRARACMDCAGAGTISDKDPDNPQLATCATCGGLGAVEHFFLDHARLKTRRYGRLVEGFDVKQGMLVPKMRSKDKAFAMLTKLLGFDKAVLEIANGAPFADTLSDAQREAYVEQLKELASMGLLDKQGAV